MRKHLLFAFLLLVVILLNPFTAHADSLDVNASVPYDIPTVPATITSPVSGESTSAIVQLSGTCEFVDPASIVSIWRGTSRLGNAACSLGGTFDITVSLVNGNNVLTPKTSNLSDIFGPDGAPIALSYTPPYVPPVDQPTPIVASDQSNPPTVTAQQTYADVSKNVTTITISIVITGGTTPYTLDLNWGDGVTETIPIAEPGTYSFSHTYEKADTYTITAKVIDIKGAVTIYQIPVITTQKSTNNNLPLSSLTVVKRGSSSLVFIAVIFGVLAAVATTFWIGEHYQLNRTKSKLLRGRRKLR